MPSSISQQIKIFLPQNEIEETNTQHQYELAVKCISQIEEYLNQNSIVNLKDTEKVINKFIECIHKNQKSHVIILELQTFKKKLFQILNLKSKSEYISNKIITDFKKQFSQITNYLEILDKDTYSFYKHTIQEIDFYLEFLQKYFTDNNHVLKDNSILRTLQGSIKFIEYYYRNHLIHGSKLAYVNSYLEYIKYHKLNFSLDEFKHKNLCGALESMRDEFYRIQMNEQIIDYVDLETPSINFYLISEVFNLLDKYLQINITKQDFLNFIIYGNPIEIKLLKFTNYHWLLYSCLVDLLKFDIISKDLNIRVNGKTIQQIKHGATNKPKDQTLLDIYNKISIELRELVFSERR